MASRVSISEARKKLFELFERVTSIDGETILIQHRNSTRRAVLISEEAIDRMEAVGQGSPPVAPGLPFSLFGSAELLVPPDQLLRSVRGVQTPLARAKMGRLAAAGRQRRGR